MHSLLLVFLKKKNKQKKNINQSDQWGCLKQRWYLMLLRKNIVKILNDFILFFFVLWFK